MSISQKIIGRLKVPGKIDVTDPCYDKDVWCRINDIKMNYGEYICKAWYDDDTVWGKRVKRIGIYYTSVPKRKEMKELGTIGVDSATAGFFIDKPDFSDKEWDVFCRQMNFNNSADTVLTKDSFFSESGFGDGEYPVLYHKDENHNIDALEIIFL